MNKTFSFSLPETEDSIFHSTSNLPLVVYFYPRDNTPGCTNEAVEFSALLKDFQAASYTIAGISRDSLSSHQRFRQKHDLRVRLLSDEDETVCRLFDVIKEKNMYGKKVMGIERSTFILDKEGHIIKEWRKVKAAGHAQEVLDFVNSTG